MKAGLYRAYDGTLIYVAKDRTIKAFTSRVCQDGWTGAVLRDDEKITVATSELEQRVSFSHNGRTVEAMRIDNVPNGCTDPLRELSKAALSVFESQPHHRPLGDNEHLVDYIYAACETGDSKRLLKPDCLACGECYCDECGPPQPGQKKALTGKTVAPPAEKDGARTSSAKLFQLKTEPGDRRYAVAVCDDPEGGPAERGQQLHARFAQEYLGSGQRDVRDTDDIYDRFAKGFFDFELKNPKTGTLRNVGMPAVFGAPYGGDPLTSDKITACWSRKAPGWEAVYFTHYAQALVAGGADVESESVKRWREGWRGRLRGQGFRFCHVQSARKHRKSGHHVVPMFDGTFAWVPRTRNEGFAHDFQTRLIEKLRDVGAVVITAPAGLGKTG